MGSVAQTFKLAHSEAEALGDKSQIILCRGNNWISL